MLIRTITNVHTCYYKMSIRTTTNVHCTITNDHTYFPLAAHFRLTISLPRTYLLPGNSSCIVGGLSKSSSKKLINVRWKWILYLSIPVNTKRYSYKNLFAQVVIWTSIQGCLNVMGAKWTPKQRCVLAKTLLKQDVILTSIQRSLNVMDVKWKSKQRCVLFALIQVSWCFEVILMFFWTLWTSDGRLSNAVCLLGFIIDLKTDSCLWLWNRLIVEG